MRHAIFLGIVFVIFGIGCISAPEESLPARQQTVETTTVDEPTATSRVAAEPLEDAPTMDEHIGCQEGEIAVDGSCVPADDNLKADPGTGTTDAPASSMEETQSMDGPVGGETISMADVAENDGQESCWTVVDGRVYDVTEFADRHKGGERNILNLCGTDGSAAVRGQHGMGKDSTLERYYIGDLA